MLETGPDLSDLKLATAALAAIAGFGFVLAYIFGRLRADRTAGWPSVPGIVEKTRLVRRWGMGAGVFAGGLWWMPEVTYRYDVGGAEYTGRRVFSPDTGFPKKSLARGVIDRYPAGAAVEVFHHPSRPKRAFLERAPHHRRSLGMAVIFFAIAGAALIAG